MLSLSVFSLPFRFLSSASLSVPATQPLFLPFRPLPVSASQWLPRCSLSAFASLLSPFLPGWFPIRSLPVLRTRLPVRFLSSFPVSLPQPFHRCFPSFPLSLLFGDFPFPSGFFRPLLFRFWLLGLCFFLSSFFLSLPHSGFLSAAS